MSSDLTYGFIITQEKMSEELFNKIHRIAAKYVPIEKTYIKHEKRKGIRKMNEPKLVNFSYGIIRLDFPKAIEGCLMVDPVGELALVEGHKFNIGEISLSHESFFLLRNDGEDIPLVMDIIMPAFKELYYFIKPIIGCWWGSEMSKEMCERIESCYNVKDASLAVYTFGKINVFPPWIAESLGKERIKSIPHFVVEELKDGGFLVHYPFDDFWNRDQIRHEEEAKNHLRLK